MQNSSNSSSSGVPPPPMGLLQQQQQQQQQFGPGDLLSVIPPPPQTARPSEAERTSTAAGGGGTGTRHHPHRQLSQGSSSNAALQAKQQQHSKKLRKSSSSTVDSAWEEGAEPAREPTESKLGWSKFTRNLFEMASSPENGTAIGFNADGDCLEIRNPRILGSDVLPNYYKHKNVSSFVRQLNNYGFKTTPSAAGSSDTLQSFYHENFRRGRLDLLGMVSRRGGPKGGEKDPKTLQVEIASLKRRENEQREKAREMEEQNRHLLMENNGLIEENKRLKANWNIVRGSIERQKPPPPMQHHQQQQQQQQQQHGYHDGGVSNMYYAADPHQQAAAAAMYMGHHMPVPLFTSVTQQQSMDPNMLQHLMTDEEFHRGGGPYGNMES